MRILVYAHAYFSCIYAHDTPPRVQHFSAFHCDCICIKTINMAHFIIIEINMIYNEGLGVVGSVSLFLLIMRNLYLWQVSGLYMQGHNY